MPTKCNYDKSLLQGYLRSQSKIITRGQAEKCGLSSKAIDYRLRPGGAWQRVLPGVYAAHTGAISLVQQQAAAVLYAGKESVMTGAMAVRRHNLDCPGTNTIDVLIPIGEHRKSRGFVNIIRTSKMPDKESLSSSGAVTYAPIPRAVADAARLMTRLEDARAVVASALQRGRCSFRELVEELEEGPSGGSRYLAMALAEVSDGARSNAEILLHKLIDRSELEQPLYNASLYTEDGDFIAEADTWWQRAGVAGEVDSRQYHFKAEHYAATQKRHNHMESYGISVQHWLPSVIRDEPLTVLDDLGRALEAGFRRPPLRLITIVNNEVVPMPPARGRMSRGTT